MTLSNIYHLLGPKVAPVRWQPDCLSRVLSRCRCQASSKAEKKRNGNVLAN